MSDDIVKLSDKVYSLFTGSKADAQAILKLHRAYLDANSNGLDREGLKKIWSHNPDCVWFNGTGYNYFGIQDWLKLWEYFRPRCDILEPWRSHDVRLIGNGEIAVVTSERTAKGRWKSESEEPDWTGENWPSRSTEVFARENGEWRCVHVHISTQAQGKRHEERE